ncbi:MAG TPA: DUF6427 family protein [Bacteroidales bacterium]|nr:DUF6427 family protein [Bacteroidales bacterium]
MFLRLFRGTGPGVVLLIFLSACFVWLNAFLEPKLPVSFHYDINPMPLYALIRNLAIKSAIGGTIFSFMIILLMTFLLVNFNTAIFFINERTFLPSIIYVLFSGLFPSFQVFNPVLPAAFLLMIALRRIMDAYRKNGTAYNFFDASLIISIGSLIYANLIWFGLLTFVGIALLRTVNLKELLLGLLGLCTPPAIIAGIFYVLGKDMGSLIATARFNLLGESESYYFSRVTVAGIVIIGLAILASTFYLFSVINSKKIRSRKTFWLLIWVMIISFTVYFAVPSVSVEMIFIAAIPASYLLTHYFVFSKKQLLPEIFFTALIIITIAIQVLSVI